MSKYTQVSPKPNYPSMQDRIISLWKERGIKKKVLNMNKGTGEVFSFYEGPPTANGNPHAGHVLTRSLKDVYTRFAGMNGYYVPRKGGWDTHGLPVEISVEKYLGISGKQDIEDYGVEAFIAECKKNVWLCIDRWKEFSEKVAYSLDLDEDCYVPYENDYIESIWWSLSELDKKGFLYKGHKILPCCPSCQTALSSHEVAQGYKDRKDLTATAMFPCVSEDAVLLAWTTTPWTLPSNVALCVNPDLEYAYVKTETGTTYILLKTKIPELITGEYEELRVVKGTELVGLEYEPLYDFSNRFGGKKGYRVVCDHYVTDAEGTGIVHIAPAYGADDNRVGVDNDLPFLQMVANNGRFVEDFQQFAGKYVFDDNENINLQIVTDLAEKGKLFAKKKVSHSYPHCWRCGTPLMYSASDSWFVKTTAYKDELLRCNNEVNWYPESFKTGRMGNFLQNNVDWCLSRNRFWGTPLPIWVCECGHHKTVGSIAELVELTSCDPEIELHKPYIDAPTMKCPHCGRVMHREKDVIDVWYDSGAMPFAQFHYPFENKEEFERRYPADFIFEGYDQTRGWFYTLEAINVALFGKAPMKNCLANGMICDSKGFKMSKSKGNYEDPMKYINQYGGDIVRFMFYSNGQPYNDVIFSEKSLIDTQRQFNDVLYNAYAFYVLYANISDYSGCYDEITNYELTVMDRFILSKLNKLIADVSSDVAAYRATEASRNLQAFCETLSNWYIRCNRRRFYSLETTDNEAAFATLHTVLTTLVRLCAPFVPFIAEEIYQNIEYSQHPASPESVHLCQFPKCRKVLVDSELERSMNDVIMFCELGRSAREKAGMKIRQPLAKIYVSNESNNAVGLSEEFLKIVAEELNIEEVSCSDDIEQFLSFSIKANLPKLGPKYGKLLGKIKAYLETCDAKAVRNCIKTGNVWIAEIDGTTVELTAEDLMIRQAENGEYHSSSDGSYCVVLDCHLTPELVHKGYVREFISRAQKQRKECGYSVTDRITLMISGDEEVITALKLHQNYVQEVLLANSITFGAVNEDYVVFEITHNQKLNITMRLA